MTVHLNVGSIVEGFVVDFSASHDDQVNVRQVYSENVIPQKVLGWKFDGFRVRSESCFGDMLNYLGQG